MTKLKLFVIWRWYYIRFVFRILFNVKYHEALHGTAKRLARKEYNYKVIDQEINRLDKINWPEGGYAKYTFGPYLFP